MTRIPAIYRDGVFVPKVTLPLPDDTAVELLIEDIPVGAAKSTAQRADLRKLATASMKRRKLLDSAPRFTRDELHDRR